MSVSITSSGNRVDPSDPRQITEITPQSWVGDNAFFIPLPSLTAGITLNQFDLQPIGYLIRFPFLFFGVTVDNIFIKEDTGTITRGITPTQILNVPVTKGFTLIVHVNKDIPSDSLQKGDKIIMLIGLESPVPLIIGVGNVAKLIMIARIERSKSQTASS